MAGYGGSQYPVGFPDSPGARSETLQMREVAMMMMMDQITDKPNWHEKVFDEAIVQKWREEASEQSEDGLFARIMQDKETDIIPKPRARIMSEEAFEFCIAELRNKAEYFDKSGLVPTFDSAGNTIVKSDRLINDSLRQDLVEAFDTLRATQAANVDWHPRSGDIVQNLVHPSMYPFVYNQTQVVDEGVVGISTALDFIGQGKPVGPPRNHGVGFLNVETRLWSDKYQWLPANVAILEDGSAKFTSYVNNLHPIKHQGIYDTLQRAIDVAIPVWDQCLREVADYADVEVVGRRESRFDKITEASDSDDHLWSPDFDAEQLKHSDITLSRNELVELDEECSFSTRNTAERAQHRSENKKREREGLPPLTPHIDEASLARAKWIKFRRALLPEPMAFEEIDYAPLNSIREKFKKDGLQVIVKMASIELTPEKPEFPAGGWHLEGQMNERICATALFYIDSENVTSNHLSFRMQTDSDLNDEIDVEQDQYNYLEQVYGTGLGYCDASYCLQNFGDVETRMGRLLAFPNVFQHRVSPLRLEDPTKPGHRRFLALWLIDPHRPVVSTATVPPQQKEWWTDAVNAAGEDAGAKDVPKGLMTVEQAQEHRLALMDERSAQQSDTGSGAWEYEQYSFCEH